MCNIIKDLPQTIEHSLIPQDPWLPPHHICPSFHISFLKHTVKFSSKKSLNISTRIVEHIIYLSLISLTFTANIFYIKLLTIVIRVFWAMKRVFVFYFYCFLVCISGYTAFTDCSTWPRWDYLCLGCTINIFIMWNKMSICFC